MSAWIIRSGHTRCCSHGLNRATSMPFGQVAPVRDLRMRLYSKVFRFGFTDGTAVSEHPSAFSRARVSLIRNGRASSIRRKRRRNQYPSDHHPSRKPNRCCRNFHASAWKFNGRSQSPTGRQMPADNTLIRLFSFLIFAFSFII